MHTQSEGEVREKKKKHDENFAEKNKLAKVNAVHKQALKRDLLVQVLWAVELGVHPLTDVVIPLDALILSCTALFHALQRRAHCLVMKVARAGTAFGHVH